MDVCSTTTTTTTAPDRHLPDHISNGSMNVALSHKCQMDLRVTLTMMKRKSDEHTKTLLWFANTKV